MLLSIKLKFTRVMHKWRYFRLRLVSLHHCCVYSRSVNISKNNNRISVRKTERDKVYWRRFNAMSTNFENSDDNLMNCTIVHTNLMLQQNNFLYSLISHRSRSLVSRALSMNKFTFYLILKYVKFFSLFALLSATNIRFLIRAI